MYCGMNTYDLKTEVSQAMRGMAGDGSEADPPSG
jgi:hypothetical protein